MNDTVIPHPNGDSPEQIAADLLRAAFGALSAVPYGEPWQGRHLGDAQGRVNGALTNLKTAWPVV